MKKRRPDPKVTVKLTVASEAWPAWRRLFDTLLADEGNKKKTCQTQSKRDFGDTEGEE